MKYLIAVLCSALSVQFAAAGFAISFGTINLTESVGSNPSAAPGTTVNDSGFLGVTEFSTPAGPDRSFIGISAISVTAVQNSSPYGSIFSSLGSTITVYNDIRSGLGVVLPSITLTITQDAYSFSGVQNAFFTSYTATGTGSFTNTTVTHSATAGSSTLSTGAVSLSGGSASVSSRGSFVPGSSSIIQQFTITNLSPGQSITFSSFSSISTPVPATAFALLAGVPVLALARRRLFA
jgi:hypothetical protein